MDELCQTSTVQEPREDVPTAVGGVTPHAPVSHSVTGSNFNFH